MLGLAWQRGLVPVTREALLMRAIELNKVEIDRNKAAFASAASPARSPTPSPPRSMPPSGRI